MFSFFYSIIIFPLVQIIDIFFLFIYRVFHSPGISLLGVSFAITLLTLPLYIKAEKWQEKERDIQRLMSSKIRKIKDVFKGDEQYMILSTYYKQNHYHPVFSLRSTFGLLIQIPFFIAAWSFISGLEILNGASFIGISDLGSPDRLLHFRELQINILPILMTVINIISCMVYTKGFVPKEKLQLYIMAFLFLVLLYNSPSGLVLYWTFNNLFSLIKNIIQRFNISIKKLYFALFPLVVLFDIFILFIHNGSLKHRMNAFVISILFILLLVFYKKLLFLIKLFLHKYFLKINDNSEITKFILSILILFLLSGLVIPLALVASSPEEFSFIESYKSPFPFIFNVFLQSLGFFVFWPVCLYLFFSNKIKKYFSLIFSFFAIAALVNTFLVFENFGYLTSLLVFSEPKMAMSNLIPVIVNIILLCLTIILFFISYKRFIFNSIQLIVICAFLVLSVIYIYRINSAYSTIAEIYKNESVITNKIEPFYTLSKKGKNVMLILLDMAMPGYIPEIFNEKPEMMSAFSGFTWYPNCVSFANNTVFGAPPIYGGYEYAPLEINKRNTTPLLDKQKEANLLLPFLFLNSQWSTTLNDPPFNLSWFSEFQDIKAEILTNNLRSVWMKSHQDVSSFKISNRLNIFLVRFSFFKMMPLAMRFFVYDHSRWLSTRSGAKGVLTFENIPDYALLDYLPELTSITYDEQNNFMEIYGHLTHDSIFLQAPDYFPSSFVTDKGSGKYSEQEKYHVNMAAFLLLAKYFKYLDENGVYDNTRIIIVSDHGAPNYYNFEGNILLPNGEHLQRYHSLLMFKDFNERANIDIVNDLMSNADAALFAVKDIIDNPVNPFTGLPLTAKKENGLTITTSRRFKEQNNENGYKINADQWLHVKDNIFIESNWSADK